MKTSLSHLKKLLNDAADIIPQHVTQDGRKGKVRPLEDQIYIANQKDTEMAAAAMDFCG